MRINIQDLTVGMYVSELDRPWLETPFLFQGFDGGFRHRGVRPLL